MFKEEPKKKSISLKNPLDHDQIDRQVNIFGRNRNRITLGDFDITLWCDKVNQLNKKILKQILKEFMNRK